MTGQRGTSALGFRLFRWVGLARLQRLCDAGKDAFQIPQRLMIPESDDSESVRFESRGSRGILLDFFRMLPAVDLDNQAMSQATEIHNVIADRMLTAKLRTAETLRAKLLP